MHKVADRLDLRPSSRNGAEVRPGEIGQKVRFAISACPKERKRFGRQIRNGPGVGRSVDLVLQPGGTEYALEPQRQRAGVRGQSSDDIPIAIDESGRWNGMRQLEFSLPGDGVAAIGVNIHHGQNCRRLREVKRDVKAVANVHFEIPGQAVRVGLGTAALAKRLRRGFRSEPEAGSFEFAVVTRVLLIVFLRGGQDRLGIRGLRHLISLLIDPINDVGTIPAQFLQKLDDFGDFAFAQDCELQRQDLAAGVEFVFVLLGDKNKRHDEQREQVHDALQPGE